MITFDLECSNGHQFEGWFNNLRSFEEQSARNLVCCPYCNDTRTKRVLSTPAVMKSSSRGPEDGERDPGPIDYQKLAGAIVDYVQRTFEDVGPDFTKEALKMHYGVTDKRSIRGSATPEEEKTLREEDIEFFKIPMPKGEDKKKN
jgi:hypothetical protein